MSATLPVATNNRLPAVTGEKIDLKPTERVAVILSLMEPDTARAVAAQFDAGAADKIVEAYENLRSVPKRALLEIIASFVADVQSKGPRVRGGKSEAARLAEAIEPPIPVAIADFDENGFNAEPSDPFAAMHGNPDAVWEYLANMDAYDLTKLLSGERPSVIAAVMGKIPEPLGAGLISQLPVEKAVAVVAQLAQGRPVPNTTLDAITESIRQQASSQGDSGVSEDEYDPVPRLTAILNRCPLSRQAAVLDPLKVTDQDRAEEVEKGLLRFGILQDVLPRNAAPIVFREMDEGILNQAIRYGAENAPEAVEYLYANISQRLAQQIRERIDALPLPSVEDGEAAQAQMITKILSWGEEDRFEIMFD